MRIGPMVPQVVAAAAARDQRRAARSRDAADATAQDHGTDLAAQLPDAIADRLAGLMAADPGLAEAVSAQLPAARLRSATDIAAYASAATPGVNLDIQG